MLPRRLTWLLVILTLTFVVAVWFDVAPDLRGPTEWRWTLRESLVPWWRVVFPIVTLSLYALLCAQWLAAFKTDRPSRTIERGFLVFLTVAAPLLQLALAAAVWRVPLFEFFAATVSPSVTGFYSVAVTTPDLPAQLAHYTALMPNLPIHPQTHPPGLVMIHWLTWRLFQAWPALSDAIAMPLRTLQCHNVALMSLDNPQLASTTIGMLVPLLGGLTVWPLYAFGRRVIGVRGAALAAVVFPVLPMFAMWPGQWDQVFPLLLFTGLYWLSTGLEARSSKRLFVAGLAFSIATFLSIGNAVMIVIAGLYALTWYLMHGPWRQLLTWNYSKQWGAQASALALGCLSMWIAYAVLYQVSLAELLAVAERLASEAARCPICPSTNRSYNVWVIWNAVDFALFLSIPIVVLCLARAKTIVTGIYAAIRGERVVAWAPLVLATLVTFLVLNVAGIVRGEVSRIWAYFGPLFVLMAFLPQNEAAIHTRSRTALVIGLVAAQLIVMNTRWLPYPSFLDEPPERTADLSLPSRQVTDDTSFDRQIELLGYDLQSAGTAIDLTLYWRALTQPQHAYTVFVHALDGSGQRVGQQDHMPVNNQLPTSCWQPGEVVTDRFTIPIKPGVARSIDLGLYLLDTGERLKQDDGAGDHMLIPMPAAQ